MKEAEVKVKSLQKQPLGVTEISEKDAAQAL